MLRKSTIIIFLLFLSVLLFSQESGQKIKIYKIQFDGLVNAQKEELKSTINIKEGQTTDYKSLNKALKKLYSLDMFKKVELFISNTSEGDIVTFVVEENPYLKSIKFEGNKSVARDDLLKEIKLTEESFITEQKIKASIAAIQKKYINEGFIDAIVSYRLTVHDIKKNSFKIVFTINESKKVVVEKINIKGNKQIKKGEIISAMKTKEKFLVFVSGVLKEDEFEEDKQRVIELYNHKGFIDAEIKKFEWKIEELGKDKNIHKAIVVYIEIEEGEKYKTGNITISGNTLFTTKELSNFITLKKGEVFDKVKIDKTRFDIYNKYSDNGHLYANISTVFNRDITNRIVDVELVITEGPRVHIESYTISGNTRTKRKVIEREVVFKEGEMYIQNKVRRSYERLAQLQYFSAINFTPLPGSAEGLISLDINVEEQRTGLISFGAGYGTESGFLVNAGISENNLFGTGRKVAFKAGWAEKSQGVSLSYTEPYIFDDPTTFDISLSYSRNIYDIAVDENDDGILDKTSINYRENPSSTIDKIPPDYNYKRHSISLEPNISRRFFEYWSASLGFRTESYIETEANFTRPYIFSSSSNAWFFYSDLTNRLERGWRIKNRINTGVSFNSTDHPMSPTYGQLFSLSYSYIGGIVGGEFEANKLTFSFTHYQKLFWKLVLALHTSQGFIFNQFDGSFNVDYVDQYTFDGVYNLRGWYNYPSGYGNSKCYVSSELRFPIYDPIWGIIYYDMGKLWDDYKKWEPFNMENYKFSFGIGVQINIPMLPIRFYLARRGFFDSREERMRLTKSDGLFDEIIPVISIQGLF
ncbi:MAG: outer membrane protein assembly factor BamA [Brevinematia bacterium]